MNKFTDFCANKVRPYCDGNWVVTLILVFFVGNLIGGFYRIGGKNQLTRVIGYIQLVLFVCCIVFSASFGKIGMLFWALQLADFITICVNKKFTILAD